MLISATRTSVFLKISVASKILGLKSGSTHAFKWDSKAKMDEPRGKLLFGFDWAAGIWLKCFVCYIILSMQGAQRVDFGTR